MLPTVTKSEVAIIGLSLMDWCIVVVRPNLWEQLSHLVYIAPEPGNTASSTFVKHNDFKWDAYFMDYIGFSIDIKKSYGHSSVWQ